VTSERYLSPVLLQLLGVALLVGSAVFWAVTGRESVLLMGAAMSLIGLGAYRGVTKALTTPLEKPTPPPIAKDSEG
jgi:hypothetical protein